jgi:hypothetical protein
MKILLMIFLIVIRLIVGFNIMYWLVQEFKSPEDHSFVEIEFYLVLIIFDIWITMSNITVYFSQEKTNEES